MPRYVDAELAPIYLNTQACEQIKFMPTEDVRPERHGRWAFAGDNAVECSACGEVYSTIMLPRYYCPNCGTKMGRGGGEKK